MPDFSLGLQGALPGGRRRRSGWLTGVVFFAAGLAAYGADGCTPGGALFARRSLVPRAALERRTKDSCGLRAVGNTTAAVQWTQLRLYLLANGRAPQLLEQSGAGFAATLNPDNLGTVGITYTNTGAAAMAGVRFVAFADLDIERGANGFANEYGSLVSLATPPGSPAGAVAANGWEIDEPGFRFGNILANAAAGTLDNFHAIPGSAPDDVSFALQFPIGDLAPAQLFRVQLRLDTANIGGLQQVAATTNTTVYLNGFGAKAAGGGEGALPVSAFPRQTGDWVAVEEKGIAAEVERAIGAEQVMARKYLHVPSGTMAKVLVGYFASQAPGLLVYREPHLPTVCLPAAGWTITRQEMAGDVARMEVRKGGERREVYYWHQTRERVFANPLWLRWHGPLERWRTGRNGFVLRRVLLGAGVSRESLVPALRNGIRDWMTELPSEGWIS